MFISPYPTSSEHSAFTHVCLAAISHRYRGLIDFEFQLKVIRHTHAELAQYVALDPLDTILSEADDVVSPLTSASRSANALLVSTINELLPHFSFNSTTRRFIRVSSPHLDTKRKRGKARMASRRLPILQHRVAKPAKIATESFRKFVGREHIDAMLKVWPLLVCWGDEFWVPGLCAASARGGERLAHLCRGLCALSTIR